MSISLRLKQHSRSLNNMSLIDFAKGYSDKTDKYNLGYFHCFYDQIFKSRKHHTTSLLEIGTYYGGSILLWRDYFTNATVFALDVFQCPNLVNEERVVHIVGDAYNPEFIKTLPSNYFDIVIDDGPHTFESMVIFLQKYLPLVKTGGIMVLEDIIDKSWTPKLVELLNNPMVKDYRVVDTSGKQIDPVLKEKWKNGLDVIVIEKR